MNFKIKVDKLRENIAEVCYKTNRDPDGICIIAATKYADVKQIQEVLGLGIKNFGENRASDLLEKSKGIKGDAIWHFIGHLQSRKAKLVVPVVEYIHSIDKIKTLKKVGREAEKNNKVQKVLIEVNISGEESKYGISERDINNFIIEAKGIKNIELRGFMTMAPYTSDFNLIREIFKRLSVIKKEFNKKFVDLKLTELSMGMSNDYRIAIEEGATMIRVGSIIFK
ncbi:MAG: YggS family pyridoxal phosphate-dependent enzyme [Candidatus Humimicrobiaceae bacterium]